MQCNAISLEAVSKVEYSRLIWKKGDQLEHPGNNPDNGGWGLL